MLSGALTGLLAELVFPGAFHSVLSAFAIPTHSIQFWQLGMLAGAMTGLLRIYDGDGI
jgi:hypothetical protein